MEKSPITRKLLFSSLAFVFTAGIIGSTTPLAAAESGDGARDLLLGNFNFGSVSIPAIRSTKIIEGGVNVQSVGNYSSQDGDFVDSDNTAQVMWDVQWSPMYAPGQNYGDFLYPNYPYMLNETDIFVPKEVNDIHLTLRQAQSLRKSNSVDEPEEGLFGYGELGVDGKTTYGKIHNDVKETIEIKPDKGDVDFNSFYQNEEGDWKRLYAGGDSGYGVSENMLDVGSVAYVQEDLTKLPENIDLPEGIDSSNLSKYKMIRIASDKKGMHTVRVSGTINVDGAKSDVYVPIRATNRLRYVDSEGKIVNRVGKEFTDPKTGKTKKADWINTGPMPDFSITDPEVNKRNAEIYSKPINSFAGFDSTDRCKPTLDTHAKESSILNAAGLKEIYDDAIEPKLLIGQSSERLDDIFGLGVELRETNDSISDKSFEYDPDRNVAKYEVTWGDGSKETVEIPNFIDESSLKNDSCDQAALRIKLRETPTTETTETSTTETSTTETSTTETSTTETSTTDTPTTETSTTETPSKETSTTETPSKETSTTETPTTKTPSEDTPTTETPTAKTPLPVSTKDPKPEDNSPRYGQVPSDAIASNGELKKEGPTVNTGGTVKKSFFEKFLSIFR